MAKVLYMVDPFVGEKERVMKLGEQANAEALHWLAKNRVQDGDGIVGWEDEFGRDCYAVSTYGETEDFYIFIDEESDNDEA